jgi:hypothetical protein
VRQHIVKNGLWQAGQPAVEVPPPPQGTRQNPASQWVDVQSVLARHAPPLAHFGQAPPPQSTPVSLPSLVELVQLGAVQTVPVQLALVQSAAIEHVLAFAHFGQVPPPQSTSVSFPFFAPSEQVACPRTHWPLLAE